MAGINNNKDKEPLPEIPLPVLNDPRPAPDGDQVVSAFKVRHNTQSRVEADGTLTFKPLISGMHRIQDSPSHVRGCHGLIDTRALARLFNYEKVSLCKRVFR